MAEQNRPNLRLRIRASSSESPNRFPVESSLNATSFVNGFVEIDGSTFQKMESRPWEYGHELGARVFEDRDLQRAFSYARGPGGNIVSLSLQIDDGVVGPQDLIWERLTLDEIPFAASPRVAFSRFIPVENQKFADPGHGLFRLLVAIASPVDLDSDTALKEIKTAEEITSLREAWDPLINSGQLRVTILARVGAALSGELRTAGYQVFDESVTLDRIANLVTQADGLHLISHGAFKKGIASLLLEDAETSVGKLEDEKMFLGRLDQASLRLVFLQACQSASRQRGEPNVWSGLAPKVARRTHAVVAMQDFARMDDARRFAQVFYKTLLAEGYADAAVNAGRAALYRPDSGTWAIPALFLASDAQLWKPNPVWRAVQDLGLIFKKRSKPFPIEVVRLGPGVSPTAEASMPGPRMRVSAAVSSALFPSHGEGAAVVVIAGNYGRAKTSQLFSLYAEYATRAASNDGILPLFARIESFEPSDAGPEEIVADAIIKTYSKEDPESQLSREDLIKRLDAPFILFLDGDQDADARTRTSAFQTIGELIRGKPQARLVLTLDTNSLSELETIEHFADLPKDLNPGKTVVLIVQLLSPATVAQHLNELEKDSAKALLSAIRQKNLFDLACVPWLLGVLLQAPARFALSRSGVVGRVVNDRLATGGSLTGARRLVVEALGKIAWAMQSQKTPYLSGGGLYNVLAEVRGRREFPLEEFRKLIVATKLVCPTDDDGVRFMYPGFQSYHCAQYLMSLGSRFESSLDDITATLGRRSRVRLWEDTLTLLAGLTPDPGKLVLAILSGETLHGEHTFLAATCIHEAELAGRPVADDIRMQVLDGLIRRSSISDEQRVATRIRAIHCLGLLRDARSIPHLFCIAAEPARLGQNGKPSFEYSGLRESSLMVLLALQEEAEKYVQERAGKQDARPGIQSLPKLIESWKTRDCKTLQEIFRSTEPGIRALAAFALAFVGGEDNLNFLAEQIREPDVPQDALWAMADALLQFDPGAVTRMAVRPMCEIERLHGPAAYLVGRLRFAISGDPEIEFLRQCLKSADAKVQGMALRASAQLGVNEHLELCTRIATGAWKEAAKLVSNDPGIAFSKLPGARNSLRYYALESLRLIGDRTTIQALREARSSRVVDPVPGKEPMDLNQLSYEVTEDIYWRVQGDPESSLDGRS